jgi:hypothetical protein
VEGFCLSDKMKMRKYISGKREDRSPELPPPNEIADTIIEKAYLDELEISKPY